MYYISARGCVSLTLWFKHLVKTSSVTNYCAEEASSMQSELHWVWHDALHVSLHLANAVTWRITCATVDFHGIFIVWGVNCTTGDFWSGVWCTASVTAISSMFPLSEVGKGNANEMFVSVERALNCLNQRGQAAAACWRASRSNAGLSSTRAVESTICLLTFWLLVQIHRACLPAGDTKAWSLPCPEGRTCVKLIKLGT